MSGIQHLNCKIFARPGSTVEWHSLIPVFHKWIQEQSLPEMLVDVADYAHVPAGPGIMLIAHEAFYSVDNRENRLGLLYNRRAETPGGIEEQVAQVWTSAISAARKLQTDTPLRFEEQECEVFVNDRLLAPNTQETYDRLSPAIGEFFAKEWGKPVELEWNPDARQLFRVQVRAR